MRAIPDLLDLPPVWLVLHLLVAALVGHVAALPVPGGVGQWAGAALGLAGLGLMAAAIVEMGRRRTTVIPKRTPTALVTSGVFRFSRNPIYLADAVILAGAILWWDALLALPLVAVFVRLIETRFIRDEEARLTAAFGPEFDLWAARVHRWIGRR